MTTPAMSYYVQIIERNPDMQRQYKKHLWPKTASARGIVAFTYASSGDIYEYRKGLLTVRKSEPHKDWQVPPAYLATVEIPLSEQQEHRIRTALEETDFADMRTDPCSMVNLAGGYPVCDHFRCRFRLGGEYHFAAQMHDERLNTLGLALEVICGSSAQYRQINDMRRWIFDFKRLDRLKNAKTVIPEKPKPFPEEPVLRAIAREMESLPGHLGFYYKNLVTGNTFGIRENQPYLAASVIKLPLYLHILKACAAGTMDREERLTVTDEDKMPSCGALSLFSGEVTGDIPTLCRLMIAISDNTATNKLIGRCGISQVNESFREMGLSKTVLRRLLFDREAAAAGMENTVSPLEMGNLLEQLYRGTFVNRQVSKEALDTLLLQQVGHKLGGKLKDVPIAHKTGEDAALSNDVGIVYAKEPFVICFTGHNTDVYRWEDLMRRAAFDLWQVQRLSHAPELPNDLD